jgi:uncharacterized protein (TIGR02246 family)
MVATTPEEVYELYGAALNAGDTEAMMVLYEPGAVLVTEPGQTAIGTEQVREALEGFVALKGTISMGKPVVVQGSDLAYLASRWSFDGTGADGQAVNLSGVSGDVVRRGDDGAWRFALDNPGGIDSLQLD